MPYAPKLKEVIPLLAGRSAQLAVLMGGARPSDPTRDERAVELLRELTGLARPHDVKIALYPHVGDWLEKVDAKFPGPDHGIVGRSSALTRPHSTRAAGHGT